MMSFFQQNDHSLAVIVITALFLQENKLIITG
ncbi:hypothetical protein cce_3511 [Crocosphaera subtropica ATCC 51142]|uniref:Uncharacterized protein n=1 Tax=Crocosphaera subtropica (strain ATCC 51142 / BH68) TaxID=43989 RepID=B1WZW0_CROS5|nr:hypothetical protein cce_3511 [Crocosphaera subtropica ATCC 51142]